jgi:DUF4097 and DUF4098 domain-containing protein YvlB
MSLLATGCIIIANGNCGWDCSPSVWKEETEEVSIDPNGLTSMEVRTHNGAIDFTGLPVGAGAASVTVHKKAGGSTHADAEAAMNALDVYVEGSADGTQRIGWRWKGIKKSSWQADVSFAINAPGKLHLDAETHNGRVSASGVVGDVRILTHNGRVKVESRDGEMNAETHNGAIDAIYGGSRLTLVTHNGTIEADLSRCGSVQGEISTHNGAVELAVGANTSANLVAQTDNGHVTFDAPMTVSSVARTSLEGKLGLGGERLGVVTHNGSIRIKNAAG